MYNLPGCHEFTAQAMTSLYSGSVQRVSGVHKDKLTKKKSSQAEIKIV